MFPMKLLAVLVVTLLFFNRVSTEDKTKPQSKPPGPSTVAVIGVLSAMFTLILLMFGYLKFCYRSTVDSHNLGRANFNRLARSTSISGGFGKSVIDSLPFFRFSSLRGSKQGLECSICLSKFEDIELLRLLPKCKHAFHTSCIDPWLESHSTCPLCRYQYKLKDFTFPALSESLRFSEYPSNLSEDSNLEIFIQREEDEQDTSSFDGSGTGNCYFGRGKKGESLIRQGNDRSSRKNSFHRFKHKIIISDYVMRKRWSDLSSSDLLVLSSEMLHCSSSQRFSPSGSSSGVLEGHQLGRSCSISGSYQASESCQRESSSLLPSNSSMKRSMSDIPSLSRFAFSTYNKTRESPFSGSSGRSDDQATRRWLCTVRQTAGLFSNGDRETINEAQALDSGKDHTCV